MASDKINSYVDWNGTWPIVRGSSPVGQLTPLQSNNDRVESHTQPLILPASHTVT